MDSKLSDSRIIIIETDNSQMLHNYGAFYMEDQNHAFFIGGSRDIEVPGKKLIDADNHFVGTIMRKAICDLDAYLSERMNERDMYATDEFWKDALKYAGRTIVPHALWIDYRTVPYGYLIIHNTDCSKACTYNFADGTYTPGDSNSDAKQTSTVMELCYHGLLDQLLAQRHMQAGTASDVYKEIAGINGFLKNKRSVRAVFKDGLVSQSYKRTPLCADSLFSVASGKLSINRSGFREVPSDDAGLPVRLSYYSAEYQVDNVALSSLMQPKAPPEESDDIQDSEDATNLMPLSVKKELKKSRLYSKDGQGETAEVVVKYFNPCGAGTWLITEGKEQKNGDWLLFGMCHLYVWEWGYILLSELESIELPLGLRIERDLYSIGTVAELKE